MKLFIQHIRLLLEKFIYRLFAYLFGMIFLLFLACVSPPFVLFSVLICEHEDDYS